MKIIKEIKLTEKQRKEIATMEDELDIAHTTFRTVSRQLHMAKEELWGYLRQEFPEVKEAFVEDRVARYNSETKTIRYSEIDSNEK